MKTAAANTLIDQLNEKISKDGIVVDELVPMLKQLREFALKEEDPLVTKVLRFTYEYLEENDGAFDLQVQYEEDEEGNEYPIEISDVENLMYFLTLLKKSENKINREEIKDYRTSLKEELY
jgi:hypothetical protein